MLERFHAGVRAAVGPDWHGTALLVENASPKATSAAARRLVSAYARPRVLRMRRNLGYAGAMNVALSALDGRYVALLNSDGRPEPDMLERLAAALDDDPGALWAAPAVHGPGERGEPPGPPFEEERLAGTALLIRRREFLALGAFDPLYWFYSEDYEASDRVRAEGWALLRVPDAVFHHGKEGRSARGRFLRELLYALTHQTLGWRRTTSRRHALGRLVAARPRSLREHAARRDWAAVLGIGLATLTLPVSAALAESRRRRPWTGARLERWLERRRLLCI